MLVLCDYCRRKASLVPGSALYPNRDDLAGKLFWRCGPCDAHVGVHPGTERPLGRLANASLRRAKMRAHAVFDPLWKAKWKRDGCSKKEARGAAYEWLAKELGINAGHCHIGMFDEELCARVVEVCGRYRVERAA